MTPLSLKLVQCFSLAKRVVHYYWMHTEADGPSGNISVQNIKKIVSRMIGLPIETYRVLGDCGSVRGNFERYPDRVVILVAQQSSEWERFTTVKELCHALMDGEEDYSTTGVQTIKELVAHSEWIDDKDSPQSRSEKLAERMALELLYPLELRSEDLKRVEADGFELIAQIRGIPVPWIERALDADHIEACAELWKVLSPVVERLGNDPADHAVPYYATPPRLIAAVS